MSLDKIDLVYKEDDYHFFEQNHQEIFAQYLVKQVKCCDDFLITQDWNSIRDNSLIVAFDNKEFYQELVNFAKYQQNAPEFYRRIFIINWRLGFSDDPRDYQQKSFAGNLFPRAYDVIMKNLRVSIDYEDFYADNMALDTLRAGGVGPDWPWYVNTTYEVLDTGERKQLTYQKISCNMDIVQVLGMYLDEYMEKYDDLKHLDKFAENPVMPVVKRHYELPEEFVINRRDLGSISLPAQVKRGDEVEVKLTIYPSFLRGDSTILYPIKLYFFKVPDEKLNDYCFWAEETQQVMHDGVNYILEGDMILYFDPSKVIWEG